MNRIINSEIFNEVSQNDRSYLYRSKNTDGIGNYVFIHNYTKDEIYKSISEFNRSSGIVNDGMNITIPLYKPFSAYFKVKTDIMLDKDLRNYYPTLLVDLLRKEKQVFLIYINGKKIPDNVIQIYSTDFGTDIFIPYEYLDLSDNISAYIENINFRDKEYIHYYNNEELRSSINIFLSKETDDYFDFSTFDKNKVLIFLDGLLTNEDFRVTNNTRDNIMTITCNAFPNHEVEIFYNHIIVYMKRSNEAMYNQNSHYYMIEKGFEYPIHGVIPKRTVAFYENGLRIPLDQMDQEFRHCYVSKSSSATSWSNDCFYVQDSCLANNQFYRNYNSDYYIQGMIGPNRLLKLIKGEKTDTFFDLGTNKTLPIEKILNKNGLMYNDQLADEYIWKLRDSAVNNNYEILVAELIRRNPSNLREILKKLSLPTTNYCIFKKNNNKNISVNIKSKAKSKNNLFLTIYLNRSYVQPKFYSIDIQNDNPLVTLDHRIFDDGINYLEIKEVVSEIKNNTIHYLEYDLGSFEKTPDSKEYNATLVIPKHVINEFTNDINSHMIILEMVEDYNNLIFPDEDLKIGYIMNTDWVLDETESNYRINFINKPKNKFLVYFRNFSFNSSFIHDNNRTDVNSSMKFIYIGSENNPIPIIPMGVPELYVNGEYWTYGIDYIFSTPYDSKTTAGSLFSFLRIIREGDMVSFNFSNIENISVLNKVGMKEYESKYGLLYLSTLEFPFHSNYIDIFIDGKKVFYSDIDILSDKLIRIRNFKVPFRSIYIQTKFNIDYSLLKFLFDSYIEDEFELFIARMFASVDPSKLIQNPELPNPDDIYASFEIDAGENTDKKPNEEKSKEDIEQEEIENATVNRLSTMYIQWLISYDARTVIDCENYLGDKVYDTFKLYQVGDSDNNDIFVDCNSDSLYSEVDIGVNCNIEPIGIAERLQFIIDEIKKNNHGLYDGIDYNNLWNIFINHPVSNIILPLDFPHKVNPITGILKHLDGNIDYFAENREIPVEIHEEKYENSIFFDTLPNMVKIGQGENGGIELFTNASEINYELNKEDDNLRLEYDKEKKFFSIKSYEILNNILHIEANLDNAKSIKRDIYIEIHKNPYLEIDESDIDIWHEHTIVLKYKTNMEDLLITGENEKVHITNDKENSVLIIEGINVGETKIYITSTKDDEKFVTEIITINVNRLSDTLISVDEEELSIIKNMTKEIKINYDDQYFISYDEDAIKVVNDEENRILYITSLLENSETILLIRAKKSDLHYEKIIEIPIKLLEIPYIDLDLDVESLYMLEDAIKFVNIGAEIDSFDYSISNDSIVEIEKINENQLRIIAKDLGEGVLTITAHKKWYRDTIIEIPVEVMERPTTELIVEPKIADLPYPGNLEYFKVITNAENYTVTSDNIGVATVRIITDEEKEALVDTSGLGLGMSPEDVAHNWIEVNYISLGNVNLELRAQAEEEKENILIYPITVSERPDYTPCTTLYDEYHVVEDQVLEILLLGLDLNITDFRFFIADMRDGIPRLIDNNTEGIHVELKEGGEHPHLLFESGKSGYIGLVLVAKAPHLLQTMISVGIVIEEKLNTEFHIKQGDVIDLNQLRTIELDIVTDSDIYEYEIINPENIKVVKDGDKLLITGLVEGNSSILFNARKENKHDTSYVLSINILEKVETYLEMDSTDLNIGLNDVKTYPIYTDAKDFTIINNNENLFVAKIIYNEDNKPLLEITTTDDSVTNVHIELIGTAPLSSSKTLNININILPQIKFIFYDYWNKDKFDYDNNDRELDIYIGEERRVYFQFVQQDVRIEEGVLEAWIENTDIASLNFYIDSFMITGKTIGETYLQIRVKKDGYISNSATIKLKVNYRI